MRLSQQLILHTLGNIEDNRHANKVDEEPGEHDSIARVFSRSWGSCPEDNKKQESDAERAPANSIVIQNPCSVIHLQSWSQSDGAHPLPEWDIFQRQSRSFKSSVKVTRVVSREYLRVPYINVVWVPVVRRIVYLIGFCSHETVSFWDVT